MSDMDVTKNQGPPIVREWLGATTTGRIVDNDPDQLTFALPPERWAATGGRDGGDGHE
jgi:hypothetical protein